MGQSAWEQAAEANCGVGLCENLACMENTSLLQRDPSVDQSVAQGSEYIEQGRGFGSGGDELHGVLSPRITENLAVLCGGAKGLHCSCYPAERVFAVPPLPSWWGFGVSVPGRSLEGFHYPGRRCDLCPELSLTLAWLLMDRGMATPLSWLAWAALLWKRLRGKLSLCHDFGSWDLCTSLAKPHDQQQGWGAPGSCGVGAGGG